MSLDLSLSGLIWGRDAVRRHWRVLADQWSGRKRKSPSVSSLVGLFKFDKIEKALLIDQKVNCHCCIWGVGSHQGTLSAHLRMFQDIWSFLCHSLFTLAQCKPAESQLQEVKESEASQSCRELQTGVHVKTTHTSESKVGCRGDENPKKSTVHIMVALPTDLQQVGKGWKLCSLVILYNTL